MRFAKHLMAAFAILAVTAFSLPVFSQTLESLPRVDDQAQSVTGKLIDFTGGNSTTTTYDVFDFGFTSDIVRLCIMPGATGIVYLRMANAVTNSPAAMATALAAQRATAPTSTSAAFITGANVYGSGTLTRALPLKSGVVSPATAWTNNSGGFTKECTVFPLRTPGLVAHMASGIATIEAWAVKR